jgi:tRNA (cmo5U34)-methyltransferase
MLNLDWQKSYPNVPKNVENWLFDDGSLTAKLKNIYPNFNVKVISESVENDTLTREVNLCDADVPLVYAISQIPQNCLNLQNLGNKPLGEILFKNGKRIDISIAKNGENWGRKSIFEFENEKVVVCEFFLNNLIRSLASEKQGFAEARLRRDDIFAKEMDLIDFCFNEKVVSVFDDMVVRSVPGYKSILEFIKLCSQIYAKPDTNLYDLGCSTGATSLAMSGNFGLIIAVDNSKPMLEKARLNLKNINNIDFICDDIKDVKIKNASMVVLNLTLQFIEKDQRDELVTRIYQGLNAGGVLIICEKVHFEDQKTQEFFTNLHLNFKKSNGYSDLEIANKRQLLEDVLVTDDEKTHFKRLKKSGFKAYQKTIQNLNFQTFIAIK